MNSSKRKVFCVAFYVYFSIFLPQANLEKIHAQEYTRPENCDALCMSLRGRQRELDRQGAQRQYQYEQSSAADQEKNKQIFSYVAFGLYILGIGAISFYLHKKKDSK